MTSTPHSLSCLCQPPRYRELGIDALTSAAQHFHGDCTPSFHLLTDNVSGVDPLLNPKYSPFRQWPDSGLSKVLNTTRITSLGVTWPGGSLMAACAQPSLFTFCPRSLARPSTPHAISGQAHACIISRHSTVHPPPLATRKLSRRMQAHTHASIHVILLLYPPTH